MVTSGISGGLGVAPTYAGLLALLWQQPPAVSTLLHGLVPCLDYHDEIESILMITITCLINDSL